MTNLALTSCYRLLYTRALTLSLTRAVATTTMPFYAVARGNTPGIYESWPECQKQILGYAQARYKKFATKAEAEEFVNENKMSNPVVDRRAKSDEGAGGDAAPPVASPEKRKHESDDDSSEGEEGATKKLHTEGSGDGEDKTKFATDSDGFLVVYTDGCCQFNGKHGAKAGVGVFFGHDHPLNVSEPVKGRATNNTAEIQAATYALELAQASGFSKVAVHTDSQFMINCMTSWIKGWKKKGWVKSDGEQVKNKEDLVTLDKAMENLAVKWVHVKGHAGHEGNEMADKLAKTGSKLYKAEPE